MAQRSTEIKFRGTLAFADVHAAQRLTEVVNTMLDKSMEVFWKVGPRLGPFFSASYSVPPRPRASLATPPSCPRKLARWRSCTHARRGVLAGRAFFDPRGLGWRRCWNFVSSAKTQKTQDRCKALHEQMARNTSNAQRTLAEYRNGQDWTLAQVEVLEGAFKGIYESLQGLMNESESEVATSLAKNASMMIVAATDMRDKQEGYTWESLIQNVDHVAPVVSRSLRNRVTVTTDEEDRATLQEAVDTLDAEVDPMRKTCMAFRNKQASDMAKNSHCNAIIFAMQRAIDVLNKVRDEVGSGGGGAGPHAMWSSTSSAMRRSSTTALSPRRSTRLWTT